MKKFNRLPNANINAGDVCLRISSCYHFILAGMQLKIFNLTELATEHHLQSYYAYVKRRRICQNPGYLRISWCYHFIHAGMQLKMYNLTELATEHHQQSYYAYVKRRRIWQNPKVWRFLNSLMIDVFILFSYWPFYLQHTSQHLSHNYRPDRLINDDYIAKFMEHHWIWSAAVKSCFELMTFATHSSNIY